MVVLYLLVVGLLHCHSAEAQLLCLGDQSCSKPFCPNTVVSYMCNTSVPHQFTRWTIPLQYCDGINATSLLLRQSALLNCGSQPVQRCGLFQAYNIPPVGDAPCTSSVLYVNITTGLNGSSIKCSMGNVSTEGSIGSITILVLSTPVQPSVTVTPGLHAVMIERASNGESSTYYTIILMENGNLINRSLTNQTSSSFDGLPSDTAFNIAIVATNCAGNVTSDVNTRTLPLPPSNIMVQQELKNITTQLTISWTHMGGNVSQYNLISSSQGQNITSSPLVKDSCHGSRCTINQVVNATGGLYSVKIASINAAGIGPWSDPKQAVLSQPISQVSNGIGIGIGIGIIILVSLIVILMGMLWWWHKHLMKNIYVPPREQNLYAIERDNAPGNESDSLPIYITNQLNGCVLELNDQPGEGHHVTVNRRKLPPANNQQWYLIFGDNDTFLIVSKMNGKVLSCEDKTQFKHNNAIYWKRTNDHIMSVLRENFALGISGGHKEPGHPLVLRTMMEEDKSQMFFERLAIVPNYFIECQKPCSRKVIHIQNPDSCENCKRCIEVNDTCICCGTHYTSQSTDAQRWYIEFLHAQTDQSFLIISKLNGKALYCEGENDELEVKAAERNDDDESQHWKKEGLHIVSKRLNKHFYKTPKAKAHQIILVEKNDSASTSSHKNLRSNFELKECSDHIQSSINYKLLGLECKSSGSVNTVNGAAAVFSPKATTSTTAQPNFVPSIDNQQWYLHRLSNGHHLVVSRLNGKVLTCHIDEEKHCKCYVSHSNGGEDQQWKIKENEDIVSVKYGNYVIGKCEINDVMT